MMICIPVEEEKGLESPVCRHFGSAPAFMIVDTEGGEPRAVPNLNQHHDHGMCQPLRALAGEKIDAIVVGGIGAGAVQKLQAAGMEIYRCPGGTVGEALAAFREGRLEKMTLETACRAHDSGPHHHHGGRG